MDYMRIPLNRVAVLIGKDGEVKKKIEERADIKLEVNSATGEVRIDDSESEKPLEAYSARNVVRAIGRGFSPEVAFLLFSEDYFFHEINIKDYSGRSKNRLHLIKGRLIGTGGKARRTIEELADVHLSISGHYVAIIGQMENLEAAKKGIEMLLTGSNHSTVYRYLERKRKELKMARLGLV
ncbi:MAG: RNA-processing protein [Thermoplasmata archaeon]|nr:MAG: RNA-processing protein [Thermoplasmata archaeon]RLF69517.1 MAG: RNA-processing protein [Thermoplasmata archaeon]RLF70695.1 MAG: RNA-processing protein [Thermoplasmata archaeon]HDD59342.1 RNA-processing protein [Euryarchaeota archaeon]